MSTPTSWSSPLYETDTARFESANPVATTPLHAGLLLGYEHLIQSERGDASRHSSGFGWLDVQGLIGLGTRWGG